MVKKITIEKLAEMTRDQFFEVGKRLNSVEQKIENVSEVSQAILRVVENIEGRMGEVHTAVRCGYSGSARTG